MRTQNQGYKIARKLQTIYIEKGIKDMKRYAKILKDVKIITGLEGKYLQVNKIYIDKRNYYFLQYNNYGAPPPLQCAFILNRII